MIFSKFETMVAKRYLRAKRKEGFISVITGFAFTGIALGVATLIIVMSVMNGFRNELLSRILGINGHIGIVSNVSQPFNNYEQASADINAIGNVVSVIPMIEKQLLVSSGRSAEGAMVRGIRVEDIEKRQTLKNGMLTVNMDEFVDNNVIIGYRLAQKMGLMVGDEITLISPNGKITAFGTIPRMKSYRIAGTFDLGMYEYDAKSGAAVKADGINFPKKGKFVLEVLGSDVCDQDTLVHAYVIFGNAKLDGNVDYSFTTDGTHPFTIKALQDYCDKEKKLFTIVIPDEK